MIITDFLAVTTARKIISSCGDLCLIMSQTATTDTTATKYSVGDLIKNKINKKEEKKKMRSCKSLAVVAVDTAESFFTPKIPINPTDPKLISSCQEPTA